jgi:AcrR family transcriptional regulator
MHPNEQEVRRAGRPRSLESQQAILDATLALLATQGYKAMSIEEVAARAGVGKATIYRWWDSKENLALDALQHLYARHPVIDTGNLRHDFIAMIEDFIQLLEEKRPILGDLSFKLFGEIKTHPELFQMFYTRIMEPRFQQLVQMIERAQQRGELRKDLDPYMLAGFCCSPYIIYRLMSKGKIVSAGDHWVEQVVDAILHGIAAHHEGCNCDCDCKNSAQQVQGMMGL